MNALALTLLLAAGATVPAAPDEHARLAARRAEIEARHASESQACRDRFAVNACLDEARIRRNIALKPIELRENELDAAERLARSEAQKQRVADNQREFKAEQARRTAAARARAAAASAAGAPASAASRPLPVEPQVRYRAAEAQRAQDAEAAQRRVAQAKLRQEELKARQQAAEKRAADRAAEGRRPVAPLPLPTASGSR